MNEKKILDAEELDAVTGGVQIKASPRQKSTYYCTACRKTFESLHRPVKCGATPGCTGTEFQLKTDAAKTVGW